jgi:homoserine dehydrogenase
MSKRPSLADSMKAVQHVPARSAKPAPPSAPVIVAVAPVVAPAEQGEAKRYIANTRVGMKRITAVVEPQEHRKLKRLAVDTGESIEELMREALADLFMKRGV